MHPCSHPTPTEAAKVMLAVNSLPASPLDPDRNFFECGDLHKIRKQLLATCSDEAQNFAETHANGFRPAIKKHNRLVLATGYDLLKLGLHLVPMHAPESFSDCTCDFANRRKKARHDIDYAPCISVGKHPVKGGWRNSLITTKNELASELDGNAPRNLAVATGSESGILVVDIDGEVGLRNFLELAATEAIFEPTLSVRTGSGGLHYYYRYDKAHALRNSASFIEPGIDIRAEGGLAIAPGSLHRCGSYYSILDNEEVQNALDFQRTN